MHHVPLNRGERDEINPNKRARDVSRDSFNRKIGQMTKVIVGVRVERRK